MKTLKIFLSISFILIACCNEPTGPEKFPFEQNFYQKYSGISASFETIYPNSIDFYFDEKCSFDIKNDGSFTLKISGYIKEDSTYVNYENSGIIELHKKRFIEQEWNYDYWLIEGMITLRNNQPQKINWKLINQYDDVCLASSDWFRIDLRENSFFMIYCWYKKYKKYGKNF